MKVYNLPKGSEIQVYSGDFIIKPHIFSNFVAQYISNLDFVLDIKVASKYMHTSVCIFVAITK